MNATQLKQLKKDAAETIDNINMDKINKDAFMLLGASLAVLDHANESQGVTPMIVENPIQGRTAADASNYEARLIDYMDDELADAQKYYDLWMETGNEDFKDISGDEVRHFEMLARAAKKENPQINLQNYMVRHGAILARLI